MPAIAIMFAGLARSYKGFCIAQLANSAPDHSALPNLLRAGIHRLYFNSKGTLGTSI
jgi:hypothetical protein